MNDALVQSLKLLPHGPGFRFIDKLSALEPGRSATGEYLVKGDESFLSGHFPGQPLFPGVLLVEAGAQLGGIAAQSDPAVAPMANVRLTALRSIKITGTAKPGEVLQIETRITGRLANLVQVQVKVSVRGTAVMQGEVTLSGDEEALRPQRDTEPAH